INRQRNWGETDAIVRPRGSGAKGTSRGRYRRKAQARSAAQTPAAIHVDGLCAACLSRRGGAIHLCDQLPGGAQACGCAPPMYFIVRWGHAKAVNMRQTEKRERF